MVINLLQFEIACATFIIYEIPVDDVRTLVRWETPRGKYDEYRSKFFFSTKPRFNRTSRRKKSLL